jgi:hypothetical protein
LMFRPVAERPGGGTPLTKDKTNPPDPKETGMLDEYATPTSPTPNGHDTTGACVTVMMQEMVAVPFPEVCVRTVNENDPATVSVPAAMAPVEGVSTSGGGSEPLKTDIANDGFPPTEETAEEYDTPTPEAAKGQEIEGAANVFIEQRCTITTLNESVAEMSNCTRP